MIPSLKPLLLQSTIQSFVPRHTTTKFKSENIHELINDLTLASTEAEVHIVCSKAREKYGFDYFSLYMQMPNAQAKPFVYVMREFSNSWTEHYEKSKLLLQDPSIPITLSKNTPSTWTPGSYESQLDAQQKSAIDQAMDFGLRKVVGFPVGGCDGGQLALRFHKQLNGLSSLTENEGIQFHAEVTFFSHFVYESLQRVVTPQTKPIVDDPKLTTKELEILKWVAHGNSSRAVGEKLFISENTVLKHLKSVHTKFNVRTRQHAVAKAVAMKLIQL